MASNGKPRPTSARMRLLLLGQRPSWTLVLAAAWMIVVTSGISAFRDLRGQTGPIGTDRATTTLSSAPGLVTKPSVIRSEVERKAGRIHERIKKPQNPSGLALERYRQRAGKSDSVAMDALIRAKAHLDAMQGDTEDAGIWTWDWLGPGNIGGRVRTILTDPFDDQILWIGSASGGIWKSVDDGSSWSPVDDFMANLAVTSLVRDEVDTDILYAGTGEGFLGSRGAPGGGIFKSTDRGQTWFDLPATNNDNFFYVNRLAVDRGQSGAIYAATVWNEGTGITEGRIFKTLDGGASWDSLLTTFGQAYDVKVHPTDNSRVLVGSGGRVYYSTNSGTSWVVQNGPQASKLPENGGRCEVAFASNSTHMYVSMDRNDGEVFRTTNNGANWIRQNSGLQYMSGQGDYNNSIWVAPDDPDFIIVGGIDLYRSVDGGATLTRISDWSQYHNGSSAHADQHAIVPNANYPFVNTVYVGNDGGIQRASDITTAGVDDWANLAHDLGITQFYAGATSPNGDVIVGGSQDNDHLRYRASDGVNGWFQESTGDGGYVAIDYTNPSVIFGEYINLQIKKSIDGGETYQDATTGLGDAGGNALFIAPFAMDPNDHEDLVAGGSSIWRTTDSASSWSSIRSPRSGAPLCSAIEISKTSSSYWIGYDDGTVSKSGNGGGSWVDLDDLGVGLPDRWVRDIAVNPQSGDEAFVVFAGYEPDNVWYTSDGGLSWSNRSGHPPHDLPALQVNTIVFHPTNPDWVYIGTDLGVLASENRGFSWSVAPRHPGNEGPANVEVDDLFFDGHGRLLAATYGRGMYGSQPLGLVYVDAGAPAGGDGTQASPFRTVGEAELARGPGTAISIASGVYSEAPLTLTKGGTIRSTGGSSTID